MSKRLRFSGFINPWITLKFSELHSKAKEGGTPPTKEESYYLNGSIPFAKIDDLENKYLYSTGTRITKEGLENSSAWIVPEGSILFSNGATIGSVSINKIATSSKQGILGIIPKINVEFLYYLLQSKSFKIEITKRTTKGTFDAVYITDINEIKVLVPEKIAEQEKIGSFLSEVDNLIEKCKKRDLELLNLQKYHLKSLFKLNDSNYKITPLNQLAEIFDGTHQTPNYVDSGIPFVSVEDIKNLSLTSKYITKEDFEKNFKKYPKKDDILMTRIGDIGTSELFQENYPIAFYVSLALIKCKNIYPKFLNHFITTDFFQKELNKRTIHAAFPKKINLSEIGNCMVIVPSHEVQYKLGEYLCNLNKLIKLEGKKRELYKKVKKKYLERIFGE